MATREQIYTAQLNDLGIWHPAFAPAVRTLADLEREHQRTKKAWRDAGSLYDSALYPVIERQRRDILAHRESLGLTPKGLRRLKATSIVPEQTAAPDARAGSPVVAALMASLTSQAQTNAAVSNLDHSPNDAAVSNLDHGRSEEISGRRSGGNMPDHIPEAPHD